MICFETGNPPPELSGNGWSAVVEEDPDEIDLQMIREALEDPDCRTFS